MQKISAGLLMYKIDNKTLKVFLVHPGGPFWKNKDKGAWSIPKGECENSEKLLDCAKREFYEETGIKPLESNENYIDLGSIKQKNRKTVHAFAFEGDFKGEINCSSFINIEFPPKSKNYIKIPEVDKGEFFNFKDAEEKINPSQFELLERLKNFLKFDNNKK